MLEPRLWGNGNELDRLMALRRQDEEIAKYRERVWPFDLKRREQIKMMTEAVSRVEKELEGNMMMMMIFLSGEIFEKSIMAPHRLKHAQDEMKRDAIKIAAHFKKPPQPTTTTSATASADAGADHHAGSAPAVVSVAKSTVSGVFKAMRPLISSRWGCCLGKMIIFFSFFQ
jgi:hypothetical protein